MHTFARTATAVVLATLATAASAQGYKPILFGLKPAVTNPVLVNPALGAGPIDSRAQGEAIRAAAKSQVEAAREAARAAREAARGGR